MEPDHTQVLFTFNHMGFTLYTGQFIQPAGSLTIDPKNPRDNKVEVIFAITQLTTTSAHLNEQLQKPEFFDAAKFPEARFISTNVEVTGAEAMIYGARSVELKTRFVGVGANPRPPNKVTIGFAATASIKRSDFGLGFGVPVIGDQVDLVINAAFEAPQLTMRVETR